MSLIFIKVSIKFIISLTGTNAERGYEVYQENGGEIDWLGLSDQSK